MGNKIVFTVRGLHPWTKKRMLKAGLEYMRWDIQNSYAEKLEKLRNDRTTAWKVLNGIKSLAGKMSDGGGEMIDLTVDRMRMRIEEFARVTVFDFEMEEVDESSVRLTVEVPEILDVLSSVKVPLAGKFSTSEAVMRHIEQEIKGNYSRDFTVEMIDSDGRPRSA